ncbi:uncharacterized protein [Nicotiana sylvestris]|uniref:uncharacterized protein n=1 Tax=Nicotiana sylvestris TaxID=4096 RepID=UPI00388CE5A4
MQPPPYVEEEISKPSKEKKRKRGSPINTPKWKKSTIRKPKADTVALSPKMAQRLRDQEEEEEYDNCLLVSCERGSSDASKVAEPVVEETAVVLNKKAFSKSRAEMDQCEAELKKISKERDILKILYAKKERRSAISELVSAEGQVGGAASEGAQGEGGQTLGWRQGMDSLASEKETLREQLASLKHQFQSVKEESLARGRGIEELKAKSANELAKAKFDVEAIASSYRADVEAANTQAREISTAAEVMLSYIEKAKALEEEVVALLSNDEDSASGSNSGGYEEEDPEDEALEGAAPGDVAAEDAAPE